MLYISDNCYYDDATHIYRYIYMHGLCVHSRSGTSTVQVHYLYLLECLTALVNLISQIIFKISPHSLLYTRRIYFTILHMAVPIRDFVALYIANVVYSIIARVCKVAARFLSSLTNLYFFHKIK